MTTDLATALAAFLAKQQANCDAHHAPTWGERGVRYTTLSTEPGKRYVRIVADHYGQRSSWGFVDMTNGDILKSAGWKAPAKNFARGNVYSTPDKLFPWTGVQ